MNHNQYTTNNTQNVRADRNSLPNDGTARIFFNNSMKLLQLIKKLHAHIENSTITETSNDKTKEN